MASIYHAQNFEEDFFTTNHGFLMDVGEGSVFFLFGVFTHPRIRIQGHEQFQRNMLLVVWLIFHEENYYPL